MLKESKVTVGICRPVEAEQGVYWPSISKLHKTASLSVVDSDSALVVTSDVFQIFNLRNQERLEFEFTDEDLVEIPIELELGG